MKIRKAQIEDLPVIFELYKKTVRAMNDSGIFQWDEVYPDEYILKQDVSGGHMYVGTIDGLIVSSAAVNRESDVQYSNARWEYAGDSFAVIHRLCVDPERQNKKLGTKMMAELEALLKRAGVEAIRLDAFSDNPYALRLYDALGYQGVGKAEWRKGEFILLEKRL